VEGIAGSSLSDLEDVDDLRLPRRAAMRLVAPRWSIPP